MNPRTPIRAASWLAAMAYLVTAGGAFAQYPQQYPQQQYPQQYPQQQPGADPAVEGWGPPATARPQVQYGGVIDIPIWVNDDAISAGLGLRVFGGLDLGYLTLEMRGGWQWQRVDFGPGYGDYGMQRSHVSLGAKFEAHNRSYVTPWIGGSMDFNFWNLEFDRTTVCGLYYCYDEENWRFTPGFSGRVGVSIQPVDTLSFDLGVELATSFKGQVFTRREVWVAPFFGVTNYLF